MEQENGKFTELKEIPVVAVHGEDIEKLITGPSKTEVVASKPLIITHGSEKSIQNITDVADNDEMKDMENMSDDMENMSDDMETENDEWTYTPEYAESLMELPSRMLENHKNFQRTLNEHERKSRENLRMLSTRTKDTKKFTMNALEKMRDRNMEILKYLDKEDEEVRREIVEIRARTLARFTMNRITLESIEREEVELIQQRLNYFKEMSRTSEDIQRIVMCFVSELIASETRDKHEMQLYNMID